MNLRHVTLTPLTDLTETASHKHILTAEPL